MFYSKRQITSNKEYVQVIQEYIDDFEAKVGKFIFMAICTTCVTSTSKTTRDVPEHTYTIHGIGTGNAVLQESVE